MVSISRTRTFQALSHRNFRLLWSAQIVSELGDWLYSIAVYSLLLELTGSAKSVALAIVLQVLPQFFVSPAAGVLNDRVSRKKVMIAADIASSCARTPTSKPTFTRRTGAPPAPITNWSVTGTGPSAPARGDGP